MEKENFLLLFFILRDMQKSQADFRISLKISAFYKKTKKNNNKYFFESAKENNLHKTNANDGHLFGIYLKILECYLENIFPFI